MQDFIRFRHNKYKLEEGKNGSIEVTTTINGTVYDVDGKKYLKEENGTIHELVPVENKEDNNDNNKEN